MTIRLQLFGAPKAVIDDASFVLPFERRSQLVVLLALRRAWVGRAELAAMLWPEQAEQARLREPAQDAVPPAGAALGRAALETAGRRRCASRPRPTCDDFEAALRERRIADALAAAPRRAAGRLRRRRERGVDRLARLRARAPARGVARRRAERLARCRHRRRRGHRPVGAAARRRPARRGGAARAHGARSRAAARAARARQAYREFVEPPRGRARPGAGRRAAGAARRARHARRSPPPGRRAGRRMRPATTASSAAPSSCGASASCWRSDDVPAADADRAGRRRQDAAGAACARRNWRRRFAGRRASSSRSRTSRRAGELGARIARELGVDPGAGRRRAMAQLIAFLRERRMLLVLDNFEQLVDARRPCSRRCSAACPAARWSSPRACGWRWRAEHAAAARGPALPGAGGRRPHRGVRRGAPVRRRRRGASSRRWCRRSEAAAIVDICRQVDGLPLALELAAAWTRVLSCEAIAAELRQGTELLRADDGAHPARHASIEEVFDQSWRRLAPVEREALARLSVFRGGFTAEAARAVAGAPLPVLGALADKSLLRKDGARMQLHPLVQQLAGRAPDGRRARRDRSGARALLPPPARAAAAARSRTATATRCGRSTPSSRTAGRLAVGGRPGRGRRCFAAASSDAAQLLRPPRPLRRGAGAGARGASTRAGGPRATRSARRSCSRRAAHIEYRLDRYADAEATALRALAAAARRAQSRRRASLCLNVLGTCALRGGRYAEARQHFRQALCRSPWRAAIRHNVAAIAGPPRRWPRRRSATTTRRCALSLESLAVSIGASATRPARRCASTTSARPVHGAGRARGRRPAPARGARHLRPPDGLDRHAALHADEPVRDRGSRRRSRRGGRVRAARARTCDRGRQPADRDLDEAPVRAACAAARRFRGGAQGARRGGGARRRGRRAVAAVRRRHPVRGVDRGGGRSRVRAQLARVRRAPSGPRRADARRGRRAPRADCRPPAGLRRHGRASRSTSSSIASPARPHSPTRR